MQTRIWIAGSNMQWVCVDAGRGRRSQEGYVNYAGVVSCGKGLDADDSQSPSSQRRPGV